MSDSWEDAELYELETADEPDFDFDFWQGLLHELRPQRMLELTCGTGRLTVPLANAGLSAAVRLQLGDMRDFELEGSFDLIVIPFNGLSPTSTTRATSSRR